MGNPKPSEFPQPPPPITPPYSPPPLQQGFIELSCNITDHTGAIKVFGPTSMNVLGLAKPAKLLSMGSSWLTNVSRIDYGGTYIQLYIEGSGTTQPHTQLISGYLANCNNPSWDGELQIWPADLMFAYVSDVQATATFTVRFRGEYVFV